LAPTARADSPTSRHGAASQRDGPNELAAEPPVPAWRKFLAQFQSVLVLLLIGATAISLALWLVERDAALPYDAFAIIAIVLLNATLGFVQEARAEQAVAALRSMSAAEATVIRDGERRRVPARELVAGDLVLLEEGDTIPADARILESTALRSSEAALTGESQPVDKRPTRSTPTRRSAIASTWRSAARRSPMATDARRRRHRDAHRDGTRRRHARIDRGRDHAAAARARSRRQGARRGRRGDRHRDDRRDRARARRARVRVR
jgi:magnesium-transporting ATPase (P-type)